MLTLDIKQTIRQRHLSDYEKISRNVRVFAKLHLLVLYTVAVATQLRRRGNFISDMRADHFWL